MSKIFQLVGILVTIYFLALKMLMLFRKCTEEEAKEILKSWVSVIESWFLENAFGLQPKDKDNDSILDNGLIEEIWKVIQLVLGEALYNQLYSLACLGSVLFSMDYHSGLPCILISLGNVNNVEKQRLATILTAIIKQRLTPPEYDTRVLVDWTRRKDLDMDVLEIRYAKSKEQREILDKVIARERNKVVAKNASVVDDTEAVDLFE